MMSISIMSISMISNAMMWISMNVHVDDVGFDGVCFEMSISTMSSSMASI